MGAAFTEIARKYFDENTQLAWVVQKYMSNIRSREEWKLWKQLALFPALNHSGAVNFVSNPSATNTADRIDARRFSRQHNTMALGRKLDAAAAGAVGPTLGTFIRMDWNRVARIGLNTRSWLNPKRFQLPFCFTLRRF